jgi:hypothetical protein
MRYYGMLKILTRTIEILIGKIQRPLLSIFLPFSLLGASAATRANKSGG